MNILFIETDFVCSNDIKAAFRSLGNTLIYMPLPPLEDSKHNAYLQEFMSNVKNYNPVFIFSTDYIPFISLACGAMEMPYVSWLVNGYRPEYYHESIKNIWNYVYVADSHLYRELQSLSVPNLYFLPLAAPFMEKLPEEIPGKYQADLSMIGTIIPKKQYTDWPLASDSPLKDSTKGYLEACLACQYQLTNFPPLAQNLPKYVFEDLAAGYPPKSGNSIEPLKDYYDHTYFDRCITHMTRQIYLTSFMNEERYQTVKLYSQCETNIHTKIKNMGFADIHQEIPLIAKGSILNLYINHRHNRGGISQIAWAIMGAGGFLLASKQDDYSILGETVPVQFDKLTSMKSLAAYYYHHETERSEITKALAGEIAAKHTYLQRIEELFASLA